jgi:hypothetical protein
MNLIPKLIDYTGHWSVNDVVFFTANQVVKRNGTLVMGAGNAKAARDSLHGVDKAFGEQLGDKRLCIIDYNGTNIGALVTKQHYKDPSNYEFVKESLRALYHSAKGSPHLTYHVPYPAIGFGGLTRGQLDPLMKFMPSNVLVYINPKSY